MDILFHILIFCIPEATLPQLKKRPKKRKNIDISSILLHICNSYTNNNNLQGVLR